MADSGAHRIVCITGASSGIGRALALEMARRGWATRLIARNREALAVVYTECRRQAPAADHAVFAGDLTDPTDLERCLAWLRSSGIPDVVVQNAAVARFGPFHRMDLAAHREVLAIHTLPLLHFTHALLPAMRTRRYGFWVFVGSTSGRKPVPYLATYAASKAFVHFFAQALGEELRGTGIGVLLVIPGFVQTGFHRREGLPEAARPARAQTPETVARRIADAIEQRRTGTMVIGTWQERVAGILQRWLPGEFWARRMGRWYRHWIPEQENSR